MLKNSCIIFIVFFLYLASFCNAGVCDAWSLFKQRFIQQDGRVIDRMNQDFTHSEAIGYTLFFALSYDDRETFEKVHEWMSNNLKKNEFGLYGWKWGKAESDKWHMLDMNNATDGDMWIASSLLMAYEKYGKAEYLEDALVLLEAVRNNLIFIAEDGMSYLLPAKSGFINEQVLTINPSYLILHLFQQFARYENKSVWLKLYNDSKIVLQKSRFGCFQIHPDWVEVDVKSGVFNLKSEEPFFSYDAVRVPLFISYARKVYKDTELDSILEGYKRLNQVYSLIGEVTQPIDLNDANMSLQVAPFGFKTVFSCLAKGVCVQGDDCWPSSQELENAKKNYYSFSLLLFADILF
jgi:endoglucanase